MVVLRRKSMTKESFANMMTSIRLHLMSYVDLYEFIQNTRNAWTRAHPSRYFQHRVKLNSEFL